MGTVETVLLAVWVLGIISILVAEILRADEYAFTRPAVFLVRALLWPLILVFRMVAFVREKLKERNLAVRRKTAV